MKQNAQETEALNDLNDEEQHDNFFNALLSEEEAEFIKNYINNQGAISNNLNKTPKTSNFNFDLRKFTWNLSKIKKSA
jgi:hypothetical protein